MYQVNLRGINTKQNDRDVDDGFLQESINLQWRDGAYRPIPKRLAYTMTGTAFAKEIIMHKVSDEDKINVLMLGSDGILAWYGTIENGVYTAKPSAVVVTGFPKLRPFVERYTT